jgi:hypothetical protein
LLLDPRVPRWHGQALKVFVGLLHEPQVQFATGRGPLVTIGGFSSDDQLAMCYTGDDELE